MATKIRANAVAFAVVGLILFNTFSAVPMRGQAAGATLTGEVRDESGAVVSGAKVAPLNTGTGVSREVTANSDGVYSVPNLLPGEYQVTVTSAGFQTSAQRGITLTVGSTQVLNISLKVGQVTQTVEVTAALAAVQTDSSAISAVVDSRTVRELPLNGRDWASLATLEPGVTKVASQVGTGFSANKGNRGFGNQLTDSGHRPNENSYRVNGVIINDYSNAAPGGATGLNLGVDGIQEFSVITTSYTAEYGRTSGAIINAITKSGTNQFHGSGFFFDRDKIFDAKNYFDPAGPIPSFRRVQFGGSGGGAIIKGKTFVYGTYEGVRQDQPAARSITVPTQEARSGSLCASHPGDTSSCTFLSPVAVDPAIVPYLSLWPCPASCQTAVNADTANVNVSLPLISHENYMTARADHKVSERDSLAGSYAFDSGPQTQPDPLKNATHEVFSRRQLGTLEETHIFSPSVVNTFRIGLNRVIGNINQPLSGNAVGTNSALAIAPGAKATPQIAVAPLTTAIGLGGLNRFSHAWTSLQVGEDAFVTRGTHQIKLGFAFEAMRYNILEQLSPNGRMNSYGKSAGCEFTTLSLANEGICTFLMNSPHQLNALAPGGSHEVAIRERLFAGYVQDDWRFRSNLTFNLGLRYEFTTKPNDANNRIQEITTLSNCSASPTACGPVAVKSFIATNPTSKNFEPRVGFSYDPFRDGKTAVRGAFGIFDVLPLPYEFGLNTAATFPFQIIGKDPAATLGTGTTDPNVNFNPNAVRNRFVQQNPKRALVMNWNFNIQRELGPGWTLLAGYVGSRSVHLSAAADDINLVQPSVTPIGLLWPIGGTAIDPNWAGGTGGSGIRPVLFDGESTYHAGQAQLRKALGNGIQGQVSYTFGKCRDTSSAPVTGDTYSNSIAVPILLFKSYRVGACDFDVRHVLSASFIWNLPGPKSSGGPLSYALGGWQLGTIISATSGTPFTPTIGAGDDPLGTGFNGDFSMDYASLVKGCNPIHGGNNYLNLNCFALPTAPASFASQCNGFSGIPQLPSGGPVYCSNLLGNAGRNRLYGPGLATVDFSIFKNFRVPRISEAFNIQFRAEAFNILNHTNFSAPNFISDGNNNSIFNADGTQGGNAGVLASTSTPSRQIQLGLKLLW